MTDELIDALATHILKLEARILKLEARIKALERRDQVSVYKALSQRRDRHTEHYPDQEDFHD